MHKTRLLFFILYIYVSFHSALFGQNLNFTIEPETKSTTKILDSLSYLKLHKNYNSIKTELQNTLTLLISKGYLNATSSPIKKINKTTFKTRLNTGNQFKKIIIQYPNKIVPKSYLKTLSKSVTDTSFTIPITKTTFILNKINSYLSSNGRPFTNLKLSSLTLNNTNNVNATLIIDNHDEKRTLNTIIIKGYKKFPKSFLKRLLKIKKGSLFNINNIKEKLKPLNTLGFASEFKSPQILFTKDSTNLYLYLKKNKSNIFDGYLGFGNAENDSKITFYGNLNLNLTNNLNFGEIFKLTYRSDANKLITFNTSLKAPYLFNSPIGAILALRIFKQDSSYSTVTQSAKLFYPITPKNTIFIGVETENSSNLLNTANTGFIDDYKKNRYLLHFNHTVNQPDNFLFPVKTMVDIKGGFGNRTNNNTSNNQQHINFKLEKILNLNTKNSFYLKTEGYKLFSDSYFENELERLGGINSIRGFEENSLLASEYLLVSSEYRYLLSPSLYVHSIVDVASLENTIINQKETLFGFGFGIGVLTKAGLLKLNYGNGKTKNQPFKLSDSKIHVSLKVLF